jgi:cardiolipin synthase A/B
VPRRPTRTRLVSGNAVEIYRDGSDYFDAMAEAMEMAERFIHVEIYWLRQDIVGRSFSKLLARRCHEGVQVRLLYDQVGSSGEPTEIARQLREAGAEIKAFNPISFLSDLKRAQRRDHSKLVVVDGHTAFVGGINFSSHVLEPPEGEGWTDMGCRVSGPAVRPLAKAFWRTWARCSGLGRAKREDLVRYAPKPGPAGDVEVMPLAPRHRRGLPPYRRMSPVLLQVARDIGAARRSVDMWMAYFLPPRRMQKALRSAVNNGARVRVLIPSESDVPLVQHATFGRLGRLLRMGVEIAFWTGPMLHAKSTVIDGRIVHLGSANLDYRTAYWNIETNVRVDSEKLAVRLSSWFEEDLERCEPITLEDWRRRPLLQRLLGGLASLFARWL